MDNERERIKKIEAILGEDLLQIGSIKEWYRRVFYFFSRKGEKGQNRIEEIFLDNFEEISYYAEKSNSEEAISIKHNLKTREIAKLLINEKGQIDLEAVKSAVQVLKKNLYSLGPESEWDFLRDSFLLKMLEFLEKDIEIRRVLETIFLTEVNPFLEETVRLTLDLPVDTPLTEIEVKKACVAAFLFYLRQNIGSCFATAPGIIIKTERPLYFLQDLKDLFSTGKIKRTFGGVEYIAPLCRSYGNGDLKNPFLLVERLLDEKKGVWYTPSLIHALDSVQFFTEKEESFKQKGKKIKEWIKIVLKEVSDKEIWTMEELVFELLLKKENLNKEEVKNYQKRNFEREAMQAVSYSLGNVNSLQDKHIDVFFKNIEKVKNNMKSFVDNILVKSWEFTLASFAESKSQFTKWNLYTSLGFGPQDQGGLGPIIYHILNEELQKEKEKVMQFDRELEAMYAQIKFVEGRVKTAQSEKDSNWAQAEYRSRQNEMQSIQDLRDRAVSKANRVTEIFDEIVESYYAIFPKFFQEVYDPEMVDIQGDRFDDSPAGFRLLFKHGRSLSSLWSYIRGKDEFIECLQSFFILSESEIVGDPSFEGLEDLLKSIVFHMSAHVRTEEFLESSLNRMIEAHNGKRIKNPLEHLDQISKKPWAYTSGGNIHTLIGCYFKNENRPKELSRWLENEKELFTFLIETLQTLSPKIQKEVVAEPDYSLLMHSPTHVFLLKPNFSPLQSAWKNDAYAYTWTRDYIIKPLENALREIVLTEEEANFLFEDILEIRNKYEQHLIRSQTASFFGLFSLPDFRNHILGPQSQFEQSLRDFFDQSIFERMPLLKKEDLKMKVEQIIEGISSLNKEQKIEALEIFNYLIEKRMEKFLTSKNLRELLFLVILLTVKKTKQEVDHFDLVIEKSRKAECLLPSPLLFADTNWLKAFFALSINPGNYEIELWQMDRWGLSGGPMSNWKEWLNGSRKDLEWGIFIQPYEYK